MFYKVEFRARFLLVSSKTWRMTSVHGMSFPPCRGSAPQATKCKRHCGVRRAACFPQATMNLPHRNGRSQKNKDVLTEKKFVGSSKLQSTAFKEYPQEQQPHGKPVCTATLKCWANTNRSHSPLQSGKCNSHSNTASSAQRAGGFAGAATVCTRPKPARTVGHADSTSQT